MAYIVQVLVTSLTDVCFDILAFIRIIITQPVRKALVQIYDPTRYIHPCLTNCNPYPALAEIITAVLTLSPHQSLDDSDISFRSLYHFVNDNGLG